MADKEKKHIWKRILKKILSSRSRLHLVQGFMLLTLFGMTALALWPLQKEIDKKLEIVRQRFLASAEEFTNREIEYDGISPSILRFFEIRGFRLRQEDSTGEDTVQINRIRIHYRIIPLLQGNFADAISRVVVSNSDFYFDAEKDQDLLLILQDLVFQGSESSQISIPFSRIVFQGKNLDVTVNLPAGTLSISDLFYTLKTAGNDSYSLKMNGITRIDAVNEFPILDEVQTEVSISGDIAKNLDWSDLRLNIDDFDSSNFSVRDQTFQLAFQENEFSLRKIQDEAALDLSFGFEYEQSGFSIDLLTDSFQPSEILELKGMLSQWDSMMDTRLTGSLSFSSGDTPDEMVFSTDVAAEFPDSSIPGVSRIEISSEGDESNIDISHLSVISSWGTAEYAGTVMNYRTLPFPRGVLSVYGLTILENSVDEVRLDLVQDEDQNLLISGEVHDSFLGISSLFAELEYFESSVSFVSEILSAGESVILSLDGFLDMDPLPYLDSVISIKEYPLDGLISFLENRELPFSMDSLNGYGISGDLLLATDFQKVSYAAAGIDIRNSINPGNSIQFDLFGSGTNVTIQDFALNFQDSYVTGDFNIKKDFEDTYSLSLFTDLNDIPFTAFGKLHLLSGLTITGDYGTAINAGWGGENLLFSLETVDFPVRVGTYFSSVSVDIAGEYRKEKDWNGDLNKIVIKNIPYLQGENSLTAAGSVNQEAIQLSDVTYLDQYGSLSGSGYVAIPKKVEGVSIFSAWINMKDTVTNEVVYATASRSDEEYSIYATVNEVPLRRFVDMENVSGSMTGSLYGVDLSDDPEFSLEFEIPDGRFGNHAFDGNITADIDSKGIEVIDGGISYQSNKLANISGKFLYDQQEITLYSDYYGIIGNSRHYTDINITAIFPDFDGELATIDESRMYAELAIADIDPKLPDYPLNLTFSYDTQNLTFFGGPQSSITGEIDDQGMLEITLEKPLPIAFTGRGSISDGNIDITMDDVYFDFSFLSSLVEIPFFTMTRGDAVGNNLRISGPLNDPDFYGTALATGVWASTDVVPEELGPFGGNLVFDGKSFKILDSEVPVGSSRAVVGVDFTMDHWVPRGYDVRITTLDDEGIHINYGISQLQVDGYAVGTFGVRGENADTRIYGDLTIQSCSVSINEQAVEEPKKEQRRDANFRADMNLTTGKGVQFFWPSRNIPILRAYAKTGEEVTVSYNSGSGSYSIIGDVEFQGGEILYFKRNFYLQNGNISFNENETKFDPVLGVKAEIREVALDGNPVSIFLVVDKAPFSRFSPRFESSPFLSSAEIASILGIGQFTGNGTGDISISATLAAAGDILGQVGLNYLLEDRIRNWLGLDLFSFRTSFVQNLIVGSIANITDPGIEHYGSSIAGYLDNTTLLLGKYFKDDLFLEVMIQLEANDYNTVLSGGSDLIVSSEISLEWRTPFFLLDLSVFPDFADPISTVTSTSLGFSWEFSY